MSEEDKSHTAILLPGARVALYTHDTQTKESFQALSEDWRFARVVFETYEGDADTAANSFVSNGSPDLVIVQTEVIDDDFSVKLENLAANCSEGTAAIIIGPVNDVNLYRRLVGLGVSDYLVRPVQTETFADNIASTLIERLGATGSRLIAVMGAKGGVGTTVLSEAMAWGVADRMDQKTFLLDAAGGWSSLSVGMNFEPSTTLAEAVRAAVEGNNDSFTRMLFSASDKLTVLSSGGDVMLEDLVSPENYETLLDRLMATYPVLIVDLSGANSSMKRTVLTRAHEILLLTTPTLPSVRATRTLLHEIKELRGGTDAAADVIINMVGLAPKSEVSKVQIEQGLERKVAALIPWDPGLFIRVESEGKKLGDDKTGAPIVDKLLPLVRKVLAGTGSESVTGPAPAEAGEKKSGLGNILSKIKAKS